MLGDLTSSAVVVFWVVLVIALIGGLYALFLLLHTQAMAKETPSSSAPSVPSAKGKTKKEDPVDRVSEIQTLLQGCMQASSPLLPIGMVVLVLLFLLAGSVFIIPSLQTLVFPASEPQNSWFVVAMRMVGGLVGSILSAIAILPGIRASVTGMGKTVVAARKGYGFAMQAAHRAGAVAPMLTASLGLLGSGLLFALPGEATADLFLGFVFGVVFMAFFWRVGWSLVTGASVIGHEMLERTPPASPESAATPMTLAVMVGESAEGSASTTADLFKSTEITFVATLLLGFLLAHASVGTLFDGQYDIRFLLFPFLVRGVGVLASFIGNLTVRTDEQRRNAIGVMKRGVSITLLLAILTLAATTFFVMKDPTTGHLDWRPAIAASIGLALVFVLNKVAEHFTSMRCISTKLLCNSSHMGTPSNLLSGLSTGFEASAWTAVSLAIALAISGLLYMNEPASTRLLATFYSLALSGLGMLSLNGYMLAIGGFGSIARNAHRLGTMANLEKNPRNTLEDLDAIGSMTRTMTKGVAAGAVMVTLAALIVLFSSTILLVYRSTLPYALFTAGPLLLAGLLIGSGLPFLLSHLTIRSVTRGAAQVVNHHHQLPPPDPATTSLPAVSQMTPIIQQGLALAQRDLLALGMIALLIPLIVGLVFRIEGLGGLLVGLLLSGPLLASTQSYAAGAWGTARKTIEEGFFGGKHSEAHRATMLGSIIAEPLRDAIGPVLLSLITLVSVMVLLVLPGVLQMSEEATIVHGVLAVCAILLVAAILYLKREGEPIAPTRRVRTPAEEVRAALPIFAISLVGIVAFAWGSNASFKHMQPDGDVHRFLFLQELSPSPSVPTATMRGIEGESSTPLPTYTPFPTYTPLPTYTPFPTYTPLAFTPTMVITATEKTVTETVTETAIAETVTSEPVATDTPEPIATDTPEPIATDTPEPIATDTPEPIATDTPTGSRVYVVQPGDTLSAIAVQHNTTVSAIMEANNLTPAQANSLRIGQELVIPAP